MKTLSRFVIFSLLFCSAALGHDTNVKTHNIETLEQNQSVQVLNEIPKKLRRNILSATAKITNIDGSHGTGTYMTYKSTNFILTAAHVVRGFESTFITLDGVTTIPAKVTYVDPSKDIAILIPESDPGGDPIKFKRHLSPEPGERLVYAGFPGWHDVLMFTGIVSGTEHWEHSRIIMHSYAWKGCSGSVVFDHSGKVVGVLIAIDYMRMPAHPHPSGRIVEDIVWIEPVDILTGSKLQEIFSGI